VKSNPEVVKIIVFTTKGKKLKDSEKAKVGSWLETRLKSKKIKVFYEQ
jgi:hypothetical protein